LPGAQLCGRLPGAQLLGAKPKRLSLLRNNHTRTELCSCDSIGINAKHSRIAFFLFRKDERFIQTLKLNLCNIFYVLVIKKQKKRQKKPTLYLFFFAAGGARSSASGFAPIANSIASNHVRSMCHAAVA
jgi:hypothetical protein